MSSKIQCPNCKDGAFLKLLGEGATRWQIAQGNKTYLKCPKCKQIFELEKKAS